MSSARSTHWRYQKLIKIDLEKLQGRDMLGDLGTDGKIIITQQGLDMSQHVLISYCVAGSQIETGH